MSPIPPGYLSPRINPEVLMMICTAGHVDHGKTELVKLLTGCRTDRLKDELERGMTIELGFAPCYLGSELCVGIVDVPGHERFIKNMVAGVSGIEMTVLIIAADDGVMPQTVEHLQIMDLLGVRRGMVALTKTDLVSPDHVRERVDEIRAFLRGTFLDGCPICPVSAKTFEGYPEFYDVLVQQIKSIVKKRRVGVFRMPIERVFVRPGFGAVVTGIPVDGAVAVGDAVEVVPGGQRGKVRTMQRFLRDVQQGEYGQCLALNVPEFNKKPPVRGQVVCAPGYLNASSSFHLHIKVVPGLEKPLRNAEEVKFHAGTAEEPGKIYLFGERELAAGSEAPAFVLLHNPVAAAAGDRCILRRASPPATVAGGEIVDIGAPDQRASKKQILDKLQERRSFFEGADPVSPEGIDRRTEYVLLREKPNGASLEEISKAALLPMEAARASIGRLTEVHKVLTLAEGFFIHNENYGAHVREVEARLEKAGKADQALSLTLSDLRKNFNWLAPLWNRIQGEMEQRHLVRRKGEKMIIQAAVDGLQDADRALMDRLINLYGETGYHSPRPEELPQALGVAPDKIGRLLDYLCSEGRLIPVAKGVILTYEHFKKAQDAVVKLILEKGSLNSADFKYVIDSSRKYALAILDYLDSQRVTIRIGNDRKLTPDYQRHLV
jgi:selenocysteine-specific elongation factor